jgi:hypothetical protein
MHITLQFSLDVINTKISPTTIPKDTEAIRKNADSIGIKKSSV